jgi:hypothetical protein
MGGRGFYPIFPMARGSGEDYIDLCLYIAYSKGKSFEVDQDRRREA